MEDRGQRPDLCAAVRPCRVCDEGDLLDEPVITLSSGFRLHPSCWPHVRSEHVHTQAAFGKGPERVTGQSPRWGLARPTRSNQSPAQRATRALADWASPKA